MFHLENILGVKILDLFADRDFKLTVIFVTPPIVLHQQIFICIIATTVFTEQFIIVMASIF